LLFVIYFFSVVFVTAAGDHLAEQWKQHANVTTEEGHMHIANSSLVAYYGPVPAALLSLFMAISGGDDWNNIRTPLLTTDNGWLYGMIFTFYIFFMVFGVLNVVVGTFVETAADVARRDQDAIIEANLSQVREYARNIRKFFKDADKDKSGLLSFAEFESHLADERVKAYFTSLDLDVSQAKQLFQLMDTDEGGALAIEEFIGGCMRLKGESSVDVNLLLYQNDNMCNKVDKMMEVLVKKVGALEKHCGTFMSQEGSQPHSRGGSKGPPAPDAMTQVTTLSRRKFAESAWTAEKAKPSTARTKTMSNSDPSDEKK